MAPVKRAASSTSIDEEAGDSPASGDLKKKSKRVAKKPRGSKKATTTTKKKSPKAVSPDSSKDEEEEPKKSPKKKKKAPAHQQLTERDVLPKLWNAQEHKDSYTLKICSWNVAGLRALLRNHPQALPDLVAQHDVDILCLQETKLQEMHLDDPKLLIRTTLLPDYDSYYSCSTAKKGYSGTAIFVKKRAGVAKKPAEQMKMDSFFGSKKKGTDKSDEKANTNKDIPIDVSNLLPNQVSYKCNLGKKKDPIMTDEGRTIVLDFDKFSLTNVYVPNSGQKLERLDYRTNEWDKDFWGFHQELQQTKPTLWCGDLNVAHTNLEVWNDGAKHLPKQAGVTPQERESFTEQLKDGTIRIFVATSSL